VQSALGGALVGAAIGDLLVGAGGRSLLDRVDECLDVTLERLRRVQDAASKVQVAVEETKQTLHAFEHATDKGSP
jgi:hypothetical protein